MRKIVEYPKYARLTIKGVGLKYTTVLPLLNAADVIAYIDANHKKVLTSRMPPAVQKDKE